MRAKHGVGCMNVSGEALLSWCALNGSVVLNTKVIVHMAASSQ